MVQEVKESLNKLGVRKATGSRWRIMVEFEKNAEQLAEKLHTIMSASLSNSKVLQDWKRGNLMPIFKGGKRENPLNYRLVSLP